MTVKYFPLHILNQKIVSNPMHRWNWPVNQTSRINHAII